MFRSRILTAWVVFAALLLVQAAPISAHEAPIRVVVLGEDSDASSVRRNSEIYKRVVAELQQSMIRENITVIDEDMIAVKLGFSYNVDRTKQDLIETLAIANQTTDATVRSRLGLIFSIYPEISNSSVARLAKVRVRGQIFDLKSLRAVASFEVVTDETVPLPLSPEDCNKLCVSEKVGKLSTAAARELGAVLSRKLHILIEDREYADLNDPAAIIYHLSERPGKSVVKRTVKTRYGDFILDTQRALDFEIYFEFDSSKLTAEARRQLDVLGNALVARELRGALFLIAGHTDAKGSTQYNLALSYDRASAVATYLLAHFEIKASAIIHEGFGEEFLKDPENPNSGINRRVEVAVILSRAGKPNADMSLSGDGVLTSVYTVKFTLMKNSDILRTVRALEAYTVREIELLKSSETQRIYSVTTNKDLGGLEERIMNIMLDLGIDIDQHRFSSFGTELSVEAL